MKKTIQNMNYKTYSANNGEHTGIEYFCTRNTVGNFDVTICLTDYEDILRTKEVPDSLPEEAIVSLHNVRYIGEYKNYQTMDEDMFHNPSLAEGSVCHVAHNEDDQFVLWYKGKSYYITVE